jgi:hypothetical protein
MSKRNVLIIFIVFILCILMLVILYEIFNISLNALYSSVSDLKNVPILRPWMISVVMDDINYQPKIALYRMSHSSFTVYIPLGILVWIMVIIPN